MPTLTLLCGLPGSGKTTHARALEAAGAVRLGADDWMVPLFGHHMPREVFDARLRAVKTLQWALAEQLLRRGLDVVLDDGFWRRAERDEYRRRAQAVGCPVRVLHFELPLPELRRRVARRSAQLPPGTFALDDAALDLFAAQFEPPHPDEGDVTVVGTGPGQRAPPAPDLPD